MTSGGAIPEVADYRVVLEPDDTFIGTLNEDFAIESMAGDIFQLGNASWRVLQVAAGVVRVADAQGRAAEHSVLARRSAGAQRRALARRQRSARETSTTRLDAVERPTPQAPSTWLAARNRRDDGGGGAGRRLPRRRTRGALGAHADAGDARARTLLRRVRRHAARAARAVRQPHQQGVGPGAAEALLPAVQFRAAGGRHRRRPAAVARTAAFVSAGRRVPLPASGDRRATCWSRRSSTRRCSRRGGGGIPRSRWPCRAAAADARCPAAAADASPTI